MRSIKTQLLSPDATNLQKLNSFMNNKNDNMFDLMEAQSCNEWRVKL